MKHRRHHNNKGHRQIRNGGCARRVQKIADKLGIRFVGDACDICGLPNPSVDHREICQSTNTYE
jgi:hypothetical protein